MKKVEELHRCAMELAEEASIAQLHGEVSKAKELFEAAFEKEQGAADLVAPSLDLEPTRSVLHRSAASLAMDCGQTRAAERLVARGLAGNPPEEIAEELRDLLEQVNFHRHLELHGVVLQPGEFQMSIDGAAVGHGIARAEQFVPRVQDLEKVLYRTAERKANKPFREGGRREKWLTKEMEVYLSTPRAASLAVSFRIGHLNQRSIPGFGLAEGVLEEVLDCMELLNAGDMKQIEARISDPAYRRNFLGLARRIAPDGEAVRLVGFTSTSRGKERRVSMTRLQSQIPPPTEEKETETAMKVVTVNGTLKFADSTKKDKDQIKLVDDNDTKHIIRVPTGMMDDIVRPLWDFDVEVTGVKRGTVIVLRDIRKLEGENE